MKDTSSSPDLHALIGVKAMEVEEELRKLNRWQSEPLSSEKFENMGAFGSNTMTFEQWLQFVLVPRIRKIVADKDEFPPNSMLCTYANRVFDGDGEVAELCALLYTIDQLINEADTFLQQEEAAKQPKEPPQIPLKSKGKSAKPKKEKKPDNIMKPQTVSLGDATTPDVVFTLAGLLPSATGQDLEDQLQTFDTFLGILSSSVRPQFADLFLKASSLATNDQSKKRLEQAAASVNSGGRAAEPHNHEEAMRRYREEHDKNFGKR